MKLIPVVLLLSCLGFGQVSAIGTIPMSKPGEPMNFSGQYVLVTRQWRQGMCFINASGTAVAASASSYLSYGGECAGGWDYQFTPYQSEAEAMAYLKKDCGSGYPCLQPTSKDSASFLGGNQQFIAIYKLATVLDHTEVKFSEGDHVTTKQVEEREHWFKWESKLPKEAKR